MLTEQMQLLDFGSTGSDAMPLGFVISDDGRTLLAVMGNEDGMLELVTTPVAYIQQNGTIVQSMIKPVFHISLDQQLAANVPQSTGSIGSENYGTVCLVTEKPSNRLKTLEVQSNDNFTPQTYPEVPKPKNSVETAEHSLAVASANRSARRTPGRPRKDANPSNSNKMRCEICGQEFKRQMLYRKHMEHHAQEKPHRCPKCSASFNVPTNFTLHMATHNTGDPKCPECGRKFARMASLKSHMLIHEKEESLFCTECEDAFTTKAQLDAHLKLHNEKWSTEDVRKCRLCHKQFTQPALYRLHIREHYRTKIVKQTKRGTCKKTTYKCKICSKSFQKPSQLMRHIRVHTGEKPFKCTVCTRAFTQKGSLQIHMWQHVGVRPYGCEFCNAKFSQKGNLNAHVLRVHNAPDGEPIYSCTHCTCVFKKLGSLNGHMKKMHSQPTEEAPQKCDSSTEADIQATVDTVMSQLASLDASVKNPADSTDPELTTTSEGDILQQALKNSGLESKDKHSVILNKKADAQTSFVTLLDRAPDGSMRRYLTIKQRCIGSTRWYACSFCHKEFKKPSDLIRHLRVHTQEKPFKCSFCYRSFALKSTMIAHERTHTGTKKYQCNTCDKTFGCHGSLSTHARTHAKPHKCSSCDKTFGTIAMLKSHAKIHAKTKSKLSPEAEILVPQIVLEEPLIISDAGNKISVAHVQSKQKQIYDNADLARPHKCWVCPAAFRKISHLKQHYRRHTGERPYKCSKCDRRFTSNSVLKSHLQTHEESRPYSCSVCNAKFSTQSSMKRHLVTHSNKRPFMCPYCHKTFKTSVNCRKHMKIHKTELAQQQLEQQRTQQDVQLASPMKDGRAMPLLTENVTISDDTRLVTFQSEQTAPDFDQAFNDQLQKISVDKEKTFLPNDEITRTIDNQTLPVIDSDNLGTSQTLHADETGTITLPNYSGDQTLTPESIREIEETLNQQLFNIGMHDANSESLESRDQPVLNIIYENSKELDSTNNGSINSSIFPSHFDAFDMSHITLQTDTEIDMGISSANSTSMASILPRSAQEEQRLVPVTTCSNVDDSPNKSSRHLMVVSSMQTCPELSRPVQACPRFSKVIAKADTTDLTDIPHADEDANGRNSSSSAILTTDTVVFACSNSSDKRVRSQKILDTREKSGTLDQTSSMMNNETPTYVFETESLLQCHMCSQKGFTMETLKNHLSTHRGTKEFQCTECPMRFCTNGGLSRHLKMHASKQQWNCPMCLESFPNEAQLKLHTKMHDDLGWNVCPIEPDSSQKDSRTIEASTNFPTVEKKFLTPLNPQTISSHDRPTVPEKIHQNSSATTIEKKEHTNKCKYCPKTFRKPSDLIRHVRTHTGERPFRCEYCDKSFAVKCTLDCHTKVHTGKKTFCCHVCNSMFATKGSLKVHMRLHTGSKPFRCSTCDLRFRTSGHRKVHELTHTRESNRNDEKRKLKHVKIAAIAEVVAQVEKTIDNDNNNVDTNVVDDEQRNIGEFTSLDNITIDGNEITDHQITFNADGTIFNDNSILSINESNQLVANLHFLLANGLVTIQADETLLDQGQNVDVDGMSENVEIGEISTITNVNLDQRQQQNLNFDDNQTEGLIITTQMTTEDHQQHRQLNDCMTIVQIDSQNETSTVDIKSTENNSSKETIVKSSQSKKECDVCGKTFMKPCQVERHKRVHTGERPYKCQLCDKSFAQKSTLQMHQKHHTGDRPHPCPHCDYSFTQKGNLQTHLKRAHQSDANVTTKIRRGQQQQGFTAKIDSESNDDGRLLNFDDISFVEFLK